MPIQDRAALEAALNPAKTNDLYFVADGTGGHAFTENLKDHNSAVQKWRDVEKQAKAKAGASDKDTAAKSAEPDPDVAPIPESGDAAVAEPAGNSKLVVAPPPANGPAPEALTKTVPKTMTVTPASAADIPLPVRKPKKP